MFSLFVFLFTFFIRLRILESKAAKIWDSDEYSTFLAQMSSNHHYMENITFTARILSFIDKMSKRHLALIPPYIDGCPSVKDVFKNTQSPALIRINSSSDIKLG